MKVDRNFHSNHQNVGHQVPMYCAYMTTEAVAILYMYRCFM